MRPVQPSAVPTGLEPTRPDASRLGLAAVVAGALCIAASPVLVRLSELEPTATGFHRVFLAVPVLAVWAFATRRSGRATVDGRTLAASAVGGAPAEPAVGTGGGGALGWGAGARGRGLVWLWSMGGAAAVLAGLLFAADLVAWHWSLRYTTVANSTFIANLSPVFVTALAWSLFKERVTKRFLLGMVVAIAGASLIVRASFDFGAAHLLGDLLALATSLFYAGYLVSVKGLRRRLPTARLMLAVTVVTSVALLPACLAAGEGLMPRTLRGLAILLALAWVSQVLGQGLIAYGMAHVPASVSSVSLLLQPVAAAVLAWAVLAEAVTWWQGLGGVGVLLGIALARAGSAEPARRHSPEARPKGGRPV